MMPAVRPHDDHSRRVIIPRSNDDDGSWAIPWVVPVVVGTCVSMVIRPANYDVTAEIRIPEAQRDPDTCLGLRDTRRKAKQQSHHNEHAFHGFLLLVPV